jgi:hypothetical protein
MHRFNLKKLKEAEVTEQHQFETPTMFAVLENLGGSGVIEIGRISQKYKNIRLRGYRSLRMKAA